jgi:prepilin-type N-terminal cleavage/methylation domain-containing protein/prepilin-type processing-associated H-X9-DG protein
MRRRAGFTLIELLAVIAILTILVVVGLPTLRRMAFMKVMRNCASNVSKIGKGLAVYTSVCRDDMPWLVSDNLWDAPTGAGQMKPPSAQTTYNVSALLFVLVQDGQSPGIFVCPGTKDKPDPNVKTGGRFHWDFSPFKNGKAEHISYSYQAPIAGPIKETYQGNSGVTSSSEAGVVVVADRTPTYDGLKPDFDWANPGSAEPKTGMSQNHSGGEHINLLYADLHVGDSLGRADVGINNDNIYTAAGFGADGNSLDTNQGPGSLKLADHRSMRDSFLLGPKKMEK